MANDTYRTAFVHEWLTTYAGSEKVVEATLELYPEAPVYTLVHEPAATKGTGFDAHPIHTSFLSRLPWARRHHRWYLPLFPLAIEQFDLGAYDLIFSSHHSVAKGVLPRTGQLHISYVHTPMRYAWDQQFEYLRGAPGSRPRRRLLVRLLLHYLRLWDVAAANRVDVFVANSRFIAQRVWRAYRRDATVIYPPVDVDRFTVGNSREDFYLTAARMVPYKRVDLVVEAFAGLDKPLVVIGDGPCRRHIESLATANVRFVGWQPQDAVADYMRRCRAFVFAAEEDFGITPVEAQAAGAPVIAYGRGGCLETVADGKTGIFFHAQTPQAIRDAVTRFDSRAATFDARAIRRHAEQFSRPRFQQQIRELIETEWQNHVCRLAPPS